MILTDGEKRFHEFSGAVPSLDAWGTWDKIRKSWGGGGIGRRNGLKIRRWRHREGSTPSRPTRLRTVHGIIDFHNPASYNGFSSAHRPFIS